MPYVFNPFTGNLDWTDGAGVPYTGATQSVDLGEYGLSAGFIKLDTTPTTATGAVGEISWDDAEGTASLVMKGGNVTHKIGEQEYARVYNDSGTTLTLGQVVYISGAQGNRVAVKLAKADSELTSRGTIGFVAETMAAGAEGFILVSGALYKLNTLGLTEGTPIYLSAATAGAYTTTAPASPNHLVILGWVERAHATVGSIYVKVDNGYELGELHDVEITSVQNNDLLKYNSTNSRWENVSFSNVGYVPYTGATSTLNLGSQNLITSGHIAVGTTPTTVAIEVRADDNAYIAPTGPTVFSDSFTEASTVLLNAHTPNVGTSWTLAQSSGGATYSVYNTGVLRPTTGLNNVGCLYLANNIAPYAAVDVSIRMPVTVSSTSTIGLVFRYVDSNNFYLLTISATVGNCILYKKVAGVWTNLGITTAGAVNGQTWRVRAVGSQIVVYANANIVKITTDTSISAAGLCGISAGTIGQNATDDVSTSWQLDDFNVINYATAGGTDQNGINVTGSIQASGQILGHGNNNALYPALSFAGDTDTGFYVSAGNNLSVAVGGVTRATFSSGLAISGACQVSPGSSVSPSLSFSADSNTGFYNYTADSIGITTGGTLRWVINPNGSFFSPTASIVGTPDIATYNLVSNSGGASGGFVVFNTTDYVETYFKAQDYSYGGGLYGIGKLYFYSGTDYASSQTPGIDFQIAATNYDSLIGDFNVTFGAVTGMGGGSINLSAGASNYFGAGGNITAYGGSSADSSGGVVTVVGGTGLTGGDVTVEGGYGQSANAGTVYILGGGSVNTGYGGTVYIRGGSDGSGNYGPVVIQPVSGGNIGVFGSSGSTQITTGGSSATFVAGVGTPINTNSTFDGYTIAQVVYALRLYGWLA